MSPKASQNLSPPMSFAKWLLAEMITEISAGISSPWDLQRFIDEGSRNIGAIKSRRYWERQIQNMDFLACNTRLDRIKSEQFASANQLVFEHIVQQARSQRKPIFFCRTSSITWAGNRGCGHNKRPQTMARAQAWGDWFRQVDQCFFESHRIRRGDSYPSGWFSSIAGKPQRGRI